jgi:hypothetical protein
MAHSGIVSRCIFDQLRRIGNRSLRRSQGRVSCVLLIWALHHVEAPTASLIVLLETDLNALSTWLIVGEPVPTATWSGGPFIIAGVVIRLIPALTSGSRQSRLQPFPLSRRPTALPRPCGQLRPRGRTTRPARCEKALDVASLDASLIIH